MNITHISDISDQRVEIYTHMNENRLKRIYEPKEGLFICESRKIIERAIAAGYQAESFFVSEQLVGTLPDLFSENALKSNAIPVYSAREDIMKNITGYSFTDGILAAMIRKPARKIDDVIGSVSNIVVLDDIENPTNVGAIFRSAAALGADAILLTKGCADPLYRRAVRVSMGTVFSVDWAYIPERHDNNQLSELCDENYIIEILKRYGFTTIAMALSDNAKNLNDPDLQSIKRKALILGNEDHGISEQILERCDHIVKIPMSAGVDSLNVAAASAVACWELFCV